MNIELKIPKGKETFTVKELTDLMVDETIGELKKENESLKERVRKLTVREVWR
jgi:beta-lactam-binding protein with PASTA domain